MKTVGVTQSLQFLGQLAIMLHFVTILPSGLIVFLRAKPAGDYLGHFLPCLQRFGPLIHNRLLEKEAFKCVLYLTDIGWSSATVTLSNVILIGDLKSATRAGQ